MEMFLDIIKEVYSFLNANGLLVSLATFLYVVKINRQTKNRSAGFKIMLNGKIIDHASVVDDQLVSVAQAIRPATVSLIGQFDRDMTTTLCPEKGEVRFHSPLLAAKNKSSE